jgi:hypothetical protein
VYIARTAASCCAVIQARASLPTSSVQGFVPVVMSYALFYGGLGQFIAGLFEVCAAHIASVFRSHARCNLASLASADTALALNVSFASPTFDSTTAHSHTYTLAAHAQLIRGATFAGTAFSSYGCFWMGWALWKYLEASATVPSVLAAARTGDTLWCGLWGLLTAGFFVVTLRKNHCLMVCMCVCGGGMFGRREQGVLSPQCRSPQHGVSPSRSQAVRSAALAK